MLNKIIRELAEYYFDLLLPVHYELGESAENALAESVERLRSLSRRRYRLHH